MADIVVDNEDIIEMKVRELAKNRFADIALLIYKEQAAERGKESGLKKLTRRISGGLSPSSSVLSLHVSPFLSSRPKLTQTKSFQYRSPLESERHTATLEQDAEDDTDFSTWPRKRTHNLKAYGIGQSPVFGRSKYQRRSRTDTSSESRNSAASFGGLSTGEPFKSPPDLTMDRTVVLVASSSGRDGDVDVFELPDSSMRPGPPSAGGPDPDCEELEETRSAAAELDLPTAVTVLVYPPSGSDDEQNEAAEGSSTAVVTPRHIAAADEVEHEAYSLRDSCTDIMDEAAVCDRPISGTGTQGIPAFADNPKDVFTVSVGTGGVGGLPSLFAANSQHSFSGLADIGLPQGSGHAAMQTVLTLNVNDNCNIIVAPPHHSLLAHREQGFVPVKKAPRSSFCTSL